MRRVQTAAAEERRVHHRGSRCVQFRHECIARRAAQRALESRLQREVGRGRVSRHVDGAGGVHGDPEARFQATTTEERRVRDRRIDDQRTPRVVHPHVEPDATVLRQPERGIDRTPHAVHPLVRDGLRLTKLTGVRRRHERAVAFDLETVRACERERNGRRICSGRDDHVVPQPPIRVAVPVDVDPGIHVERNGARAGRHVRHPLRRVVPEEVVAPAGQFVASLDDGRRVRADEPHADDVRRAIAALVGTRRVQCEHGLGVGDERGEAPGARREPDARVRLTAIRLEGEGQAKASRCGVRLDASVRRCPRSDAGVGRPRVGTSGETEKARERHDRRTCPSHVRSSQSV